MDSDLWHIPIANGSISLSDAIETMATFKLKPNDIPLIIQLVENPKYDIGFFPGCVDLFAHDCIHILLGRGVLVKDEAFVIGFTMGCVGRVSYFKRNLFLFVTKHLYPDGYEFFDDEAAIYEDAVKIASIMKPINLSKINFKEYLDYSVDELRSKFNINVDLLESYYKMEKQRYPRSPECQRLI